MRHGPSPCSCRVTRRSFAAKSALAVHAENIANRYDWPHPEEWAALRKEHGTVEADLQMILDPGESPPGTSILQSYVEAC